jgi:anti-sigma factor RsiW
MLTCKQLIESLAEYVDGRLSLSRKAAFMLHLFCCANCRAYLSNYETTITASKQAFVKLEDDQSPEEVPEDLVQAILKARKES